MISGRSGMAVDDIVLHFSRRELKVFALWADATRDDELTASWLGDPKGLDAYKRAFAKLDAAAWGGDPDVRDEEPELPRTAGTVLEYRVRRIEGDEAASRERVCNEMAKDGWRLVGASTASAVNRDAYLFFSREVADDAIDRAARQFATMATH
jgi:hypothetical protein